MKKVNKNLVHLSIAERGRAYRTAGNHDKALRCYREALRLAEQQQASDIFFQYYTQCIMESLELSGAYAEVIAYCEKVLPFLEDKLSLGVHPRRMYCHLLERQAVQHLHRDEPSAAKECLARVHSMEELKYFSLTQELFVWLQKGFHIKEERLQELQKKHGYFTTGKSPMDAAKIEIPPELLDKLDSHL